MLLFFLCDKAGIAAPNGEIDRAMAGRASFQ
jgi:hypothetical protein